MKLLNLILIACLIQISFAARAQTNNLIVQTTSPKGWIVKANSAVYQIIIDGNGYVKPVFYGSAEQFNHQQKNAQWFNVVDEVPVRGAFPDKTPVLEVVFKDHVRDLDLKYVSSEITNSDGATILKIIEQDRHYPLQVASYIRVRPGYDILEKWLTITNQDNKGSVYIENAASGSIVLPANQYMLTHMAGKWASEFEIRNTELTEGTKTLESREFKSMKTPAWYMIRPKGETEFTTGATYFGTIQYSGNWRIDFNKVFDGNVQIVAGINFWDTGITLNAGKSFTTPTFVSGYTNGGAEGAAQALQAYSHNIISPANHRNDLRPILYNSWYATAFNVNEDQQLALAHKAKELGVEMFVIDDGWFKGRKNDAGGLGDWQVDADKFPHGLNAFIKKVNDMGMQFGLWIEPEMVNPNSDMYRAHPDWVLNFPNRSRTESRHQLVLNLAREDVYQNLLKQFTALLKQNNIQYIKWDHNRVITEPGWPDAPAGMQREVRIRYINNLYRLIDELRRQFPKVWFENCSGGGGRVDLGMMARTDANWASDNTDAIDRIFIQYGYMNAYPANTMISWVTHELRHQPLSLEFKFDVSMSGVLGVGYNITKWTPDEISTARKKIEQYKLIRPIVQNGVAYRLISPYEQNKSAVQYVADNHTSVVFCYNLAEYLPNSEPKSFLNIFKLRGLDPNRSYELKVLGAPDSKLAPQAYKGDFLMNIGIAWPIKGAYKSQILMLRPI